MKLSVAIISPLLCVQERLLSLKRSMSFMQDMDFTQQAAIMGYEDLAADIPPPEIIPIPVESAKKSKKQPVKDMKEVIRYSVFVICRFKNTFLMQLNGNYAYPKKTRGHF